MDDKYIKGAEYILGDFLDAWINCNSVVMRDYCQATWIETHDKSLEYIEQLVDRIIIDEWKISHHTVIGGACIDIYAKILNSFTWNTYRFRLICEKSAYTPSINGRWGVNPISITKF